MLIENVTKTGLRKSLTCSLPEWLKIFQCEIFRLIEEEVNFVFGPVSAKDTLACRTQVPVVPLNSRKSSYACFPIILRNDNYNYGNIRPEVKSLPFGDNFPVIKEKRYNKGNGKTIEDSDFKRRAIG
ncbi:MAG: hypothetical protein Q8L36_02495 [bacterium]|nr:hypothetical protein [bacterium]